VPPPDRAPKAIAREVITWIGGSVCAFHSYFDDLALVEQALADE
jgi:hypothetical protein